uniref:Mitochondrial pyruvate carrier n=1 Tax=Pygocentrus nattereri TaxID=42514 RepID=A0A3B4D6R9_PYGNA
PTQWYHLLILCGAKNIFVTCRHSACLFCDVIKLANHWCICFVSVYHWFSWSETGGCFTCRGPALGSFLWKEHVCQHSIHSKRETFLICTDCSTFFKLVKCKNCEKNAHSTTAAHRLKATDLQICNKNFCFGLLGPKTVFFWAPVFKWGLVVAGFSDLTRPPEKLSLSQSCVITATGFIWSRYCLVIIPKNWALFAVNFFLGLCGSTQLIRIWRYNQELKLREGGVQHE